MFIQLTRRQHAALSLLILSGFISVGYFILIAPAISSYQSFQEKLEDMQFQYARFTGNIGRAGAIRNELAELTQSQPDQDGFLEEKQNPLAAADLQRLVNTMVTTHGGELISTSVENKLAGETVFPAITIKIHMRSDIEALQKLLYQVKSENPVLTLDNVQIQLRNTGRRSRRSQNENHQLEIRFDITGFIYQSIPI